MQEKNKKDKKIEKEENREEKRSNKRKIITIDLEALKDLKDNEVVEALSKTKSQLANNVKKFKENEENVEKIAKLSNFFNDAAENVLNTCTQKYNDIKENIKDSKTTNVKDTQNNVEQSEKNEQNAKSNKKDRKDRKDDIFVRFDSIEDLFNFLLKNINNIKTPTENDDTDGINDIDELDDDCCNLCCDKCCESDCIGHFNDFEGQPIADFDDYEDECDNLYDIMNRLNAVKKQDIFVTIDDDIVKGKVEKIDFENQELIVLLKANDDEFELIKHVPFDMLGVSATQYEDNLDNIQEYIHLKKALDQKLWINSENVAYPIKNLSHAQLEYIEETINCTFECPINETAPKLWYYKEILNLIENLK